MARLDRQESGPMSDEGAQVRQRRERLSMDKVTLAELADVSRDTLAAIERGEGFRRSSLTKIETALERAEEEAGIDTPPVRRETTGEDLVEFRVEGVLGVASVVVKGPVRDMRELEASIARILSQVQRGDEQST